MTRRQRIAALLASLAKQAAYIQELLNNDRQ